jgi:outer membrane lipoprotein-sorting protein
VLIASDDSCYTVEVLRKLHFETAVLFANLVIAGVLSAGVSPAAAQVNPQAAPVVRALEDHYREAKTLKAIFLERYSDGPQNIQLESGTVYFSRPGRMRWDYESPEMKLFLVDGKTAWFFIPSDRTATRAPIKESQDWRTPLALLTGKVKLRELCDRIELADTTKGSSASPPGSPPTNPPSGTATAGNVTLSCLPRGELRAAGKSSSNDSIPGLADPNQPFERVLLEVNPTSGQLSDVRVIQPGGIEIEYRFGNWEENISLQESLFHFQVPVGVAIVNQLNAPSP